MPMNIGFADVVPGRLELPTSTLSVWRSNQLSYRTGDSEITPPFLRFNDLIDEPGLFFLSIS